ncbi:MAG: DUF58 domain-containing protein [Deltaproteobacteria bacterium]|nr:DUF58 domain-containing protein [Deltaproteobacteria bacterium]
MARLKKLLAALLRYARVARDLFPLTALGALVLAGAAVAFLRYGYRQVDLILLVVGAVGLGLGVLCLLLVTGAAVWVWVRFRRLSGAEALRLECGFAARTGFQLPSLWYVPMVKLSWTWQSPEATVRAVPFRRRLHEEVTPSRRGLHEEIVRKLTVSDAFGLTAVTLTLREERAVRFVPSVGALKQMHVVRSIAGGDALSHPAGPPEGERADMRHYNPGDPIKFVLWKVFARSRQLVIRTPERAISPVRQTVAYLVAGAEDEPAAGAARVAVDSGALGSEWVLGADGNDVYAKSSVQALELLARSAGTPPGGSGAGLQDFLNKATPGGSLGRAVVFVPGRPGPWLERVVAAARSRSAPGQVWSPVEFVVCTDGIEVGRRSSWLPSWALRREPPAPGRARAAALKDVNAVCDALGGARARVMVVDRLAGRVFAEGHRRAMEAT